MKGAWFNNYVSCKRVNMIKKTFDPPPFSHGVNNPAIASYSACNSEGESDGTVVTTDCFSGYDPSILGNIGTDINYLNSNNKVKDPIILTSHSLRILIEIMTVYQCCI